LSGWSIVSAFWSSIVATFWVGPSTIYNDTVGNLTNWLGNAALSTVEGFVKDAVAAFLTVLGTVFNAIAVAYNSVIQIGVIAVSSLGLFGAVLGILVLIGLFLGIITTVKVIIKFIP
jgi:hypothetical protein